MAHKKLQAFTLVELLVVIAIIAVLISILVPSLMGARDQARTVRCAANMRQIAIGFATYRSEWNDWLPPVNSFSAYNAKGTSKAYGMYNCIGPYLGFPQWAGIKEPDTGGSYDDPGYLHSDSYWGSYKNTKFTKSVFHCPNRTDFAPGKAPQPWYGVSYGESLYLQYPGGMGTDVSSANPRGWTFAKPFVAIPNPGMAIHLADATGANLPTISKFLPGDSGSFDTNRHNKNQGANILFADGHAAYYSEKTIFNQITRVSDSKSMLNFQLP